MAAHFRYIAVVTERPEQISAYLYSHTGRTSDPVRPAAWEGSRLVGMVLETIAESDTRAEWLAQYQADRLASGMHGSSVHPTEQAAKDRLSTLLD